MRLLALLTVVFVSGTATAEEAMLSGTWSRKAEGFELKIAFEKGSTLKFSMDDGNDGCVIDAKYTVEKDGTVKCELTKFERKGDFPVEKKKGYLFSFKAAIKGKTAKITEFNGKDIDDQAKAVLEGDYSKKE